MKMSEQEYAAHQKRIHRGMGLREAVLRATDAGTTVSRLQKRKGPNQVSSVVDRFHRHYEPVTESGCWIWMACTRGHYEHGAFTVNRRMVVAHRFSYELHFGHIPDGMCVLHRCDVGVCVNPAHLFLGDLVDNIKDMDAKGRRKTASGEKHYKAKVTDAQVLEIRSDTRRLKVIARQYGISEKHAQRLRSGKRRAR